MRSEDIKRGFYRGDDYKGGEGIYIIHYATAVDREQDIVSYTSGLSICTFEAAVRHGDMWEKCTIAEFAAMVQHELKEPTVKWKRK